MSPTTLPPLTSSIIQPTDESIIVELRMQNNLLQKQVEFLVKSINDLSKANVTLSEKETCTEGRHRRIREIKVSILEAKTQMIGRLSEARQKFLNKICDIINHPDFGKGLAIGAVTMAIIGVVLVIAAGLSKGGVATQAQVLMMENALETAHMIAI